MSVNGLTERRTQALYLALTLALALSLNLALSPKP